MQQTGIFSAAPHHEATFTDKLICETTMSFSLATHVLQVMNHV